MAEKTAQTDAAPLMPYEGQATDVQSAAESLLGAMDSEDAEETGAQEIEASEADDADEEAEDAEEDLEAEAADEEEEVEEGEAEDEDSESDESRRHRYKANGEDHEVTYAELLQLASAGHDYTRKTQELAERRKAIDGEAGQYRTAREQYAERLTALGKALDEVQPKEPDWERLRRELDPGEYAAQVADWQRLKDSRAAVHAEQDRLQQEQAADHEQQVRALLEAEKAKLAEAIPEWKDPAKADTGRQALATYAKNEYGFTDDDLEGVYDHRILVILRKAQQFDQLQANGKAKLKGKTKAGATLKPGARKPTGPGRSKKKQLRQKRERLRETGHVRDAAAVIYDMLEDE